MRPIGFIPARGGSKRFPGKHLAQLGGKPLIAWTIEAALASGIFETVSVSSDDDEILRVAEQYGAQPRHRAAQLSRDDVTIETLCLNEFRDIPGVLYVLLPTSPFRTASSIQRAWTRFINSGAEALLSVVPAIPPPQWALAEHKPGRLVACTPVEYSRPRGDLSPAWYHDGGHQIVRLDGFRHYQRFLAPYTALFQVPPEETVDINTPTDLAWAEFLLDRKARGLL